MKRALFLGCGRDRRVKVRFEEEPETYTADWEVIGVDMHDADIVADMRITHTDDLAALLDPHQKKFDAIHAYDSLEHWGGLGDWRGWFDEMSVYHQLLRPGGSFRALVPIGEDALADPGHCRFFHESHFGFLTQDFYEHNKDNPITDYRWYINHWWQIKVMQRIGNHHLAVIMVPA